MLLWLAQYFQQDVGPLRVFGFITFRAVAATMTSLLIGLIFGPAVIRMLTRMKVGQAVRTNGPQTHLVKSGTPTMGGALILIAIAVSTFLWSDFSNRFVWVVLLVTMGFGAIGWVDDYRKVVYKDPKGMPSREKYFWQSVIGLIAAVYLAFSVSEPTNFRVWQLFVAWVQSGFNIDLPPKADLIVPFFKTIRYQLGVWGFIALTYFVIVGTSNEVNL
ncbi:MAG: phospho-N-acetylmuramoyl-pentapeptide-transferase, partial [Burkholderiaceae bacterium]